MDLLTTDLYLLLYLIDLYNGDYPIMGMSLYCVFFDSDSYSYPVAGIGLGDWVLVIA